MRLHLNTSGPGTVSTTEVASSQRVSAHVQPEVPATGSDSVRLSGISSTLAQFAASRAGRLAQLSGAVQGGSYQVPSSLVSRSVIDQAIRQTG